MNGEITLINTGSSLSLTDPAGGSISLSGTTTTGLQEFINAVSATGFPGRAIGSGIRSDGVCAAPFVLSSTLKLPPMAGTQIDISGTISVGAFLDDTHPAIHFDTLSRCKFHHYGTINLTGGSGPSPILFMPTTPYTANSFFAYPRKEIYGSSIRLGNIVAFTQGNFNALVRFAVGAASCNNNIIEIGEIFACGRADYGLYINTPSTHDYEYACFVQNQIRVGLLDGARVGQFCEGGAPINPLINCLGTNHYDFAGVTFGQPTIYGVSFSGVMNIAHIPSISLNAGSCAHGIMFVQNSQKNYVTCTQNDGINKVNDGGSGNVVVP